MSENTEDKNAQPQTPVADAPTPQQAATTDAAPVQTSAEAPVVAQPVFTSVDPTVAAPVTAPVAEVKKGFWAKHFGR